MSKDDLKTIGRNMYYKDISTKNEDVISDDALANQSENETAIQTECKDVVHMMVPLGM